MGQASAERNPLYSSGGAGLDRRMARYSARVRVAESLVRSEVVGVRPVGSLDRSVELGRPKWQDEQHDASSLAFDLDLGHELGPPVDL